MRCKQIVLFNWPFYAAAALTVVAAPLTIPRLPAFWWLRVPAWAATGLVALWLVTSVAASWIVYDRSRLMQWDWVLKALGFDPRTWINLHAGHDESSEALRRLFAHGDGRVFDIFDADEMTERSIARARRRALRELRRGKPAVGPEDAGDRRGTPGTTPEQVDYRRLPLATGTIDVATLLLSAHELRSDAARGALFSELRRVVGPGGRVVVAEHLRNWANFLAYGPGFLHFHSRRTWLRCFTRHRFDVHAEFSITPFVRIFVLRRLT
jgi:SAM-dependent methyltransferase